VTAAAGRPALSAGFSIGVRTDTPVDAPIGFLLLGVQSVRRAHMTTTIEIDDDLAERMEAHLEEDESMAELVEELVNMYETEGAFLQEGYSE
jgi:hypothetical protein